MSPMRKEEIGLNNEEVSARLAEYGYNEVLEKVKNPILRFLSKFWGLSAWMLEAIIIISWFLGKSSDLYIVSALLVLNAIIGFAEEQNAADAVELLKKKLQMSARVLRSGAWSQIPARELVPGDIIRVRIGDFVPADARILDGDVEADESPLTGESLGVEKGAGKALYAGSVLSRGEALCEVTLTGIATYFGKTASLVQIASPKLHAEEVITSVVKILLIIVLILLAIAFVFSIFRGHPTLEILPLMLVLLLGAIPVALPAMFTVSMAIGSRELVKRGVLVARLSAPEDAASMDILCVDKTGTMTSNKLSVASVLPMKGRSEEEVLLFGALASQEANHDPIDTAFINAARERKSAGKGFSQVRFVPFDPKTRRTEALATAGGKKFTVMKGSVAAISAACALDAGRKEELDGSVGIFAAKGYRTLAVSVEGKGKKQELIGLVALYDAPRPDSKELIDKLRALGISVKMLTGDALPVAREIATAIGLSGRMGRLSAVKGQDGEDAIADAAENNSVIAEIYPGDKYSIVKGLQAKGHMVGMTGDGVNDAPALRQAEVGIAVKNASDVAKGSAGAVLTQDGLVNILALVDVGRAVFQRINTWVVNKISRTILKTGFVVLAFIITGEYVISSSAMLLVIFMTDFVKLTLSTDNVSRSAKPDKWRTGKLAAIGAVLGLAMIAEALGLLYIGSANFGLLSDPAALSTFSFEILLYFAVFSVLSIRERGRFWNSVPSNPMLLALSLDMIAAAMIGTFGLFDMAPIPVQITLFVVGYAFVFSLVVNDFLKNSVLKSLEAV